MSERKTTSQPRPHGIPYGMALTTGLALTLAAALAMAQAPQPAPVAPPPWTQGRPPELGTSPLKPHPPSITAKPAKDIPVDKVKLPPGCHLNIWAEGMPNARSMAVGSRGRERGAGARHRASALDALGENGGGCGSR